MKSMRKSFLKKSRLDGNMSLQITSMADIFMIILVFLLKTYGSGTLDIKKVDGISLPLATPGSTVPEADVGLHVEIAAGAISVDGKSVAPVSKFEFAQEDVAAGTGASKTLQAALDARQKAKKESRLIIVADQMAPYSTIKTVLASAALTGFTDFKLAVVNPN